MRRNLLFYGLGGIVTPFFGIKIIQTADRIFKDSFIGKKHEIDLSSWHYVSGADVNIGNFVSRVSDRYWPVAVAHKSNGSLIKKGDEIVGSSLIAQAFKAANYFWARPSASSYSALPSGATNQGPTSAIFGQIDREIKKRIGFGPPITPEKIPMDLITASASGLDPHITLEAARMQVDRVVRARGLDEKGKESINKVIDEQLEKRQFWIFGEERINVLLLNLSLDGFVLLGESPHGLYSKTCFLIFFNYFDLNA